MDTFIFGIRPLYEALLGGQMPEKVLLQQGLQGENFRELFKLIRQRNVPFQMVPPERLNRLSRKNHQGVIAYMPLLDYQSLENLLPAVYERGETPLVVLLDGVTDVRNLGAIARTAECAGVHALVLPLKGSAAVNADAIKTSAGALSRLPVCREGSLPESIAFLKECGLRVIALDEKAPQRIWDCPLNGPLALVMGAEDKGVSSAVSRMADERAAIPRMGSIASLNVSVASGVVLFEAMRQRQT